MSANAIHIHELPLIQKLCGNVRNYLCNYYGVLILYQKMVVVSNGIMVRAMVLNRPTHNTRLATGLD